MKRLFNFKSFVLNEKRAQLNIPFAGTDAQGKLHHDHILDAFEDNQVMKPEAYKSNADVDPLIEEAIPGAMKELSDDSNDRIRDQITMFIYDNLKENPGYWKPEFFTDNDLDIEDESAMYADDVFQDAYEAMSLKTDLSEEGKEAWDEFFRQRTYEDIYNMQDTVEDSIKENDGLISVWRAIEYRKGSYDDVYDEITKEHHGGVGMYWSWEENAAEAHWGNTGGKLFVLHGQVRPEDVNWEQSVLKTIYDLKEEQELELKSDGKVKIVGMTTADENGKDVFVELDPEYVLKV